MSGGRNLAILLASVAAVLVVGSGIGYVNSLGPEAAGADSGNGVASGGSSERDELLAMVKERDDTIKNLREKLEEAYEGREIDRKSFAKERSETSKQQKLFDKMKVERERCCAGRDAVERICKEYLDNELMEKDQLKQAEADRDAAKESKKKADKVADDAASKAKPGKAAAAVTDGDGGGGGGAGDAGERHAADADEV